MKTLKTFLASIALIGFLGLAASPAKAVVSIDLPDFWLFNPDGNLTDADGDGRADSAVFVEKLLLTGYSHVDNTFNPDGTGTFTEAGIFQVGAYIDPATGLSAPISNITGNDVYVSWEGLAGTQSFTSASDVSIDFNNGGILKMFVDASPAVGTLKINDDSFLGLNDASSYLGLADSLTQIATLAVINGALNTDTMAYELTGGSFDLNVANQGGVGEFVIWAEMDAAAGYFFDKFGVDLDTIDSTILADGTVSDSGTLQARTSVDAQGSPHTFQDATSTEGPGIDDVSADTNVATAFNPNPDDADGIADASQEDNFELAIQAIHGLGATPDYQQTYVAGTNLLQDFFVFHVGDSDLQTIPEPGTMALMGMGLLGLASSLRRRKQKKVA